MGKKKHIAILKEFKKNLSKSIPIDRMLLFGSRAYGKPHRWSDFDLIIVSKKFRNVDSLHRALGFYDFWDIEYPVDFLCYTPEEFNKLKKQITIVKEAVENGIEI
ncbi:nucleotidyltransferase domain-containing protein [Candidatus Woesearchaeota archaeon]|nr:nucleotidyltransferase domain-containing protein [Candidatus Woesearchaeota archaeon]